MFTVNHIAYCLHYCFVKLSLYTDCSFIDTECEYVLWFKISKSCLHCNEDYVIGTVYIPPENTKYFKQNIVDLFYTELETYTSFFENVILVGDLNSRSASVNEIVIPD